MPVGAARRARDLALVLRQVLQELVEGLPAGGAQVLLGQLLLQLGHQLHAHFREVGDEVERVLNFVGDAGRELAQAGHFLALHQLGLGGLQLGQGAVEGSRWAAISTFFSLRRRLARCFRKMLRSSSASHQHHPDQPGQQALKLQALAGGLLGLQLPRLW